MSADLQTLITRTLAGDVRALGRVISLIEDGGADGKACLELLYPHTGKAYVIGITGSPGAGKSTLVDRLAELLASAGKKVAVIAVDPTSPFSGGALLGDRIRMTQSGSRDTVFIRSMASRGALGGLSPHTSEAIFAFDAAGYDFVIVETVGVGQGEVEIVKTADTVVVVLVPGMGDSVQALKAGILEIADVFVINKADYEGADRLQKELVGMLSLGDIGPWRPPIVQTVASNGKGVPELVDAIERHRKSASDSGAATERKSAFLEQTLMRHLSSKLLEGIREFGAKGGELSRTLDDIRTRKQSPVAAAEELVGKYLGVRKGS